MTTAAAKSRIAQLLEDAHYAREGSLIARRQGDAVRVAELEAKARRKRDEAGRLDPAHNDPAWGCDQ